MNPPQRKDKETFEKEALVHLDALYRYARRLTGREADAEDLLQETYLRALRFFHRYEPGTNCKAWLFRIMRNLFATRWQAQKRHPSTTSLEDTEEYYLYAHLQDPRRSSEGHPERWFFEHNLTPQVRQALDELPDPFRETLILCDVEGLSYQEIAEVTGVPVGTVRSRLNRARSRLQRKLWEDYRGEALTSPPSGA